MRLIDTNTGKMREVIEPEGHRFAILSHTWGADGEEMAFQVYNQEFQKGLPPRTDLPGPPRWQPGWDKIHQTCRLARERGIPYAWVDTCCIDKTNSTELSEAVNSMFRWYALSEVCFVHLADLPAATITISSPRWSVHDSDESSSDEDYITACCSRSAGDSDTASREDGVVDDMDEGVLRNCRWFTRGWTLQELIASKIVEFYDSSWAFRGTKASCAMIIQSITKIDESVLADTSVLSTLPVARRMAWAAHRRTTRAEDRAYCLFGIFEVNLPLLYGEGGQKAFLRLQEEIARRSTDLSLFAWTSLPMPPAEGLEELGYPHGQKYRGIFALSPKEFAGCDKIVVDRSPLVPPEEFSLTNRGLRISTKLYHKFNGHTGTDYLLDLQCKNPFGCFGDHRDIFIPLIKTAHSYVRHRSERLVLCSRPYLSPKEPVRSEIYIRTLVPDAESRSLVRRMGRDCVMTLLNETEHKVELIGHAPENLWEPWKRSFITEGHLDFWGRCAIKISGGESRAGKPWIWPTHPLYICLGTYSGESLQPMVSFGKLGSMGSPRITPSTTEHGGKLPKHAVRVSYVVHVRNSGENESYEVIISVTNRF